jgi:hypothetical protein
LVEHFGSRLQLVGLNSPSVAEDMRAQYADLVDPSLLEEWLHAPTTAPGRAVSSPWPDRIEITSIEEVSPGLYSVSAEVVELTSYELTHGGAAARIPVTLAVRQLQGQWLITGYTEQDL